MEPRSPLDIRNQHPCSNIFHILIVVGVIARSVYHHELSQEKVQNFLPSSINLSNGDNREWLSKSLNDLCWIGGASE